MMQITKEALEEYGAVWDETGFVLSQTAEAQLISDIKDRSFGRKQIARRHGGRDDTQDSH